jgi:AraC family transcriptional regulator of adaptative response/methylated-DNA-[protein]-cysteine methyltransferase
VGKKEKRNCAQEADSAQGRGSATMVSMSGNIQLAQSSGAGSSRVAAINPEFAWLQLCERQPGAAFFYAVTTTGVFCRPGCASRRPLRENVRFFGSAAEARAAGFRPCKRCKPESTPDGRPLDKIRAHIESHLDRPVPLAELGRLVHLSPFTVQRLFKQHLGVSPLAYQRALRARTLRSALKQGDTVTEAIYEAGFGSPSRAYEGAQLGMTPARFAQGGRGEEIAFATAPSPFGWVIVGATERGLCWLALGATAAEAETSLREEFPLATVRPDPSLVRMVEAALTVVSGQTDPFAKLAPPQMDLRGTAFQLRVWQALREIPRGETRTYSQLARELGNPNATRAVARACATNRVSLVVPCHRVVGVNGSLTGYRWGVERKRQLLQAEHAHLNGVGQKHSAQK